MPSWPDAGLAAAGCVVVSGGAYGIDAAVHRGAHAQGVRADDLLGRRDDALGQHGHEVLGAVVAVEGGEAAVTAALRPGALTLLRGIPAEDIPLLRHVLPSLLPGAWRIRELKPDGAPRERPGRAKRDRPGTMGACRR